MTADTHTALYLAHLNPVTNAHVEIISDLKQRADTVKVMPVIFKDRNNSEVNSKSFPFSFANRREMLESVFGDSITISEDYTFYAPFKQYMPPLLSPKSWKLRKQILQNVKGSYFSYTGDKTEGYMLRLYCLKPRVGRRRSLSAASVKEKMYASAINNDDENDNNADNLWEPDVPDSVARIIRREWDIIKRFAGAEDMTIRIAGMKFPKES